VACTRFCERPDLPHIGGTKDPDLDAVVALRPDLVVLCEEENLRDHYDHLVAAGLDTFVFDIRTVAGVASQVAALADRVGVTPRVDPLPDPWPGPPRLRAFVPIWRRPTMTLSGATYGSSVLAHLGVANVFAAAGSRYLEVSDDDLGAAAPDVILLPTEPYPFKERHRADWAGIAPAHLVDGQDLFWWGTRTPAALRRLAATLP
jgi:ABC-type Fe3+-hydroxamate transport system substrate-binding protein